MTDHRDRVAGSDGIDVSWRAGINVGWRPDINVSWRADIDVRWRADINVSWRAGKTPEGWLLVVIAEKNGVTGSARLLMPDCDDGWDGDGLRQRRPEWWEDLKAEAMADLEWWLE